jgi:hypothetical protein
MRTVDALRMLTPAFLIMILLSMALLAVLNRGR